MGLEIELNLIDERRRPGDGQRPGARADRRPRLPDRARRSSTSRSTSRRSGSTGAVFAELETDVRASLNHADDVANEAGADVVMIGILPTAAARAPRPRTRSAPTRATRCSTSRSSPPAARTCSIAIDGVERLSTYADTIAPEAACTSVQLHLQVNPETFAAHWNASQAIAGVQLALGANSPFFFGKELWRETRIALFEQATDTRSDELKAQGVRPRVWFGERWITSIFDLFEENVRYFPSLLPIFDDEDPVEVLERGDVPQLAELRLHNGTIYRWNRPVYDVVHGRPHLRVENRCLPAGPDRRRRAGQRGLLLRAGQGARRGRPAGVVADVVLGGGGELPRRRQHGIDARDLLAGRRRGAGDRAGAAPAAADGRTRA